MNELINKHTVKIQLATAFAVIGFVVYWVFIGTGYVGRVEAHEKEINGIKPRVERIPVIEANIEDIKGDLSEIKLDVKSLLKTK